KILDKGKNKAIELEPIKEREEGDSQMTEATVTLLDSRPPSPAKETSIESTKQAPLDRLQLHSNIIDH
ncbi:377_t:CDS:1, partial [Acaulospora colombiana]